MVWSNVQAKSSLSHASEKKYFSVQVPDYKTDFMGQENEVDSSFHDLLLQHPSSPTLRQAARCI